MTDQKSEALTEDTLDPARIPLAVPMLGLSLFAMGSSEFLIAGVLPQIAADLQVSLPRAGTLISGFALGVVLGAPALAVVTVAWSARRALLISQALFVAALATGLLADTYPAFLVARVVSGLAYAGFWAVAATTATRLVPRHLTARALSVVVGGLSLAMVAGGPIGAWLSGRWGWQAGFWAVAAATAVTSVAVHGTLPSLERTGAEQRPDARAELVGMRLPRLWVAFATTLLSTASYMAVFSYVAPVLTGAGISSSRLPLALAVFGIGAFVGVTVGGRTTDRHPFRILLGGLVALAAVTATFWFLRTPALGWALTFLLGLVGFLINPAVLARVYTIGHRAPTLAGATNVSAMQAGIMLAPVLAATSVTLGGLQTVGPVAAVIALAALVAAATDLRLGRRAAPGSGG